LLFVFVFRVFLFVLVFVFARPTSGFVAKLPPIPEIPVSNSPSHVLEDTPYDVSDRNFWRYFNIFASFKGNICGTKGEGG